MIVRLEHSDQLVAESIYNIFQLSYKVEAEILGVSEFPPLNRQIPDFMKSENLFYAYKIKNKILEKTGYDQVFDKDGSDDSNYSDYNQIKDAVHSKLRN